MDIKKDIRLRVYLAFTGILILAIAIIVKAAVIQVSEGEALRLMSQKAHTQKEKLEAERGNIYAEDGQLLSSTIPQFNLRVDFKSINKDTFQYYVDSLAAGLARILGNHNKSWYQQALKTAFRNQERYWLLRRNVPYYQYQAIRELPIFNKGKNIGGFIVEPNPKRVNPYGMLAYRTIGLWREHVDNIGLEQSYDSVLAGKPGSRIVRKTTGGVFVPMEGSEVEPINGRDIVTTIDMNIQDVAEHALLKILTQYNCQYGTAIVMETKTGKIKALANLGRQKDGSYWEDFNYALIPSEPGSTFKLMSLFALLEDGYVSIEDKVNVNGGIAYFGKQRVIDDHTGLGTIPIIKAFAQSSNVAFASLINKYYYNNPMKYIRHLQDLGLDKRTGLDLTGERPPLIKNTESKSWNKATSLPWIAYGYESLITPLHSLMVYNAVANNGTMVKPYLVSAIREYGKDVREIPSTIIKEKIGKPATIKQMQLALKAVVDEGTARKIKSPYYNAAGKTGTAQVADKGISYSDGVRQGSFIGYFPFENPQYTIAVVVRSSPHGAYYGAVVAAPVFKEIADKLYASQVGGWKIPEPPAGAAQPVVAKKAIGSNIYTVFRAVGLPAEIDHSNAQIAGIYYDEKGKLQLSGKNLNGTTVPDVTGMGLKDALFLLENAGLRVKIAGSGKVITQSIAPGNAIKKGTYIQLQLS